jgi:uncharacterized protein YyaL (SSP411 family)
MAQPKHSNRLARESSPYLLQHAHNPVDWYPWGEEAFAEARRRDVPIFLSVGYSTCYWCHVMERESFEDEATAKVMNSRFVCVKVDREERPEVDELSMAATVTFTGRGGWPTSVFLEPHGLRPFFAGTYFPPVERHGMPPFTRVLEALSNAWADRRDEVLDQAAAIAEAVTQQLSAPTDPVALGPRHAQTAVAALLQTFDRADGGFGGAPKFPQPIFLEFLLDARERADEATRAAIDTAVRHTLDRMAVGGVRDHLAGGFHRYSVDRFWTVPHFEKMLYDQAQLAHAYARAAEAYDDASYRGVAAAVCDDVLRHFSPPGDPGAHGFYAAIDAEVDHREGLNYLWTPDEVNEVLSPEDAAFARAVYGLDHPANFQDPHHPHEPARWVLRLEQRTDRLALAMGTSPEAFTNRLAAINAALLTHRMTRKQPGTDDKVLAAWNGLMIAGLVKVAEVLPAREGRGLYEAAAHAARFILDHMRSPGGGLLRSSRLGRASVQAPLEDHAFVVQGLLALARSTLAGDDSFLPDAVALSEHAIRVFGDGHGGFFDTPADRPDLFVRARSIHDGATPSAVGVMLHNLLDLHAMTGEDQWLDQAVALLASVSGSVDAAPLGALNPVRAVLRMMELGEAMDGRYTFSQEQAALVRPPAAAPVRVLADTEEVIVSTDAPGSFRVALEIQPGYHIVAANPGAAGLKLVPLRVGLTRGSGVAVYADYPPGDAFGVEGVGEILVHHGRVELLVVLEHQPGVGASPGTPVLGVSYQACTDTECSPPRTVELEIAVTIKD